MYNNSKNYDSDNIGDSNNDNDDRMLLEKKESGKYLQNASIRM